MSVWATRAKVHFSQECPNPTAKTAETPLLAVLAVPTRAICEKTDRVLAVLAVPTRDKSEKSLFYLPTESYPEPNAEAEAKETSTLDNRTKLFMRHGLVTVQAEQLAFKLVDRDRDLDDRKICLECGNLSRNGGWRCGNWRTAGIGAPSVPDDLVRQLQRCDGFKNSI